MTEVEKRKSSICYLLYLSVLKNIPIEVQRRLTLPSSNNAMFEAAKAPFQDALVRAGYDHQLVFSPTNQPSSTSLQYRIECLKVL